MSNSDNQNEDTDEAIVFETDHEHNIYNINDYRMIKKLGSGSYGRVYLVKNSKNKRLYAVKKFKVNDHSHPTTLREVSILKYLQHPNIVSLHQFIVKPMVCYMVMEYLAMNLVELLRTKVLVASEKMSFKYQLLQAILFCHNRRVIHRDIKPHNILVHINGKTVKICDFGLARQVPVVIKPLTPNVVTLNYRAPELLLGDQYYSAPIDIWSLGCVFAEMSLGHAPFQGNLDLDIWFRMFLELGVPSNKDCRGAQERFESWQINWDAADGASDETGDLLMGPDGGGRMDKLKEILQDDQAVDLIVKMLSFHQNKRITAQQALLHPYFKDFDKSTVPAVNEENVGFPDEFWNDSEKPEFYLTASDIRNIKLNSHNDSNNNNNNNIGNIAADKDTNCSQHKAV